METANDSRWMESAEDRRWADMLRLIAEKDERYQTQFAALTAAAVAIDKRYDQRFEDNEKAVNAALAAAKEAVTAALVAADRAVAKAEAAAEKRFEAQNEVRGQLNDVQAMLMPRAEAHLRMDALEKTAALRMESVERSMAALQTMFASTSGKSEGMRSGASTSWSVVVGAAGILIGILSLAGVAYNMINIATRHVP